MMEINEALILKLQELARLKLSAEEQQQLQHDLNDMLRMVAKMDEVDTTGVEPLVYVGDPAGHLRADIIRDQLSTQDALRNAPDQQEDHFKVPKIL